MATSTPHSAWSDFNPGTGAEDQIVYHPGEDEITNLGLLQVRAYITYDGTSKTAVLTAASEKSALYPETKQTPTNPAITDLAAYNDCSWWGLPLLNKQLPGTEDSPTWTIQTDSSEELVGRSYAGKPQQLSNMEFVLPGDVEILPLAVKHQAKGSRFTIIQCYDDPNLDKIFYIITPRCSLLGASSGAGENNSGPQITLRYKPMGGIWVPAIRSVDRVTTGT